MTLPGVFARSPLGARVRSPLGAFVGTVEAEPPETVTSREFFALILEHNGTTIHGTLRVHGDERANFAGVTQLDLWTPARNEVEDFALFGTVSATFDPTVTPQTPIGITDLSWDSCTTTGGVPASILRIRVVRSGPCEHWTDLVGGGALYSSATTVLYGRMTLQASAQAANELLGTCGGGSFQTALGDIHSEWAHQSPGQNTLTLEESAVLIEQWQDPGIAEDFSDVTQLDCFNEIGGLKLVQTAAQVGNSGYIRYDRGGSVFPGLNLEWLARSTIVNWPLFSG